MHEDGLIHQRTSWFMTFQSVLLGAFAFVFEGHIGKQNFESWFDTSGPTVYYRGFLLFLCVAGIGAAVISLHSMAAASRAIKELRNAWNAVSAGFESLGLPRIIGCGARRSSLGFIFPLYLPVLFIALWVFLAAFLLYPEPMAGYLRNFLGIL